mmetsp:Transcript_48487/g.143140  ORF Transcript_48487/g.143140 Transcript_48487/m.143140 type:complete len:231 (+) Transcript_48487:108-800(+)
MKPTWGRRARRTLTETASMLSPFTMPAQHSGRMHSCTAERTWSRGPSEKACVTCWPWALRARSCPTYICIRSVTTFMASRVSVTASRASRMSGPVSFTTSQKPFSAPSVALAGLGSAVCFSAECPMSKVSSSSFRLKESGEPSRGTRCGRARKSRPRKQVSTLSWPSAMASAVSESGPVTRGAHFRMALMRPSCEPRRSSENSGPFATSGATRTTTLSSAVPSLRSSPKL